MKYIQEFSRNYSLFQVVAYTEFNRRPSKEFNTFVDTGHPLFVYKDGPLVDIYYPEGELKKIFGEFGKVASNADYFHGVVEKFFKVVEEAKLYFEKTRFAKNLSDLKYIYELFKDFGYGEATVWVAPLIETLPQDLKTKALSAREKTQDLTSLRDEVFDYNIGKLFPELGELTHFVDPESVFANKNSDELLKEASMYREGFIFFNGHIYVGDQEEILKKLNIELELRVEKNVDSIHWQSACSGKATGKVKIVLTSKDISKIQDGDILVSPMTRPDFISGMKIASAFVTD